MGNLTSIDAGPSTAFVDPNHRYSHRPRTVANSQFNILVMSSDEFFHQTILHNKIKTVKNIVGNFSFFEQLKQGLDLLIA